MAPPDNGEQYVILLPTVLPTWRYFPAQAERTEGQILTEKSTETDTYEENLQFPQPGGTSLHTSTKIAKTENFWGVKWKLAILPLKWPLVHMLPCGNCTQMYYYHVYNCNRG